MMQRLFVGILTVVLMLVAVVLGGNPGAFPVGPDGNILSPDLVVKLLAPLALGATTLFYFFKVISAKVTDPNDPFQPGDILPLLGLKEFWIAAVSVIAGTFEVFHIHVFDEGTQALVVTAIMGVISLLQHSWSQRTGGSLGSGT